jgi:hypothetical protein
LPEKTTPYGKIILIIPVSNSNWLEKNCPPTQYELAWGGEHWESNKTILSFGFGSDLTRIIILF